MDALYSSALKYRAELVSRALWLSLTLTKYFVLTRFHTVDRMKSIVSRFYQDLTLNHVTQIIEYDTSNIESKRLYRINPLTIIYAAFLKYVCRNYIAYQKCLNVDVVYVIQNRLRPGCLFKVDYGSGESFVLSENGFFLADSNRMNENGLTIVLPKPYMMINFGSIPMDKYIQTRQPFVKGTITARDLVIMYCIDEREKLMNGRRVDQLLKLVLQNGITLTYVDHDFNELEYKECDIVL